MPRQPGASLNGWRLLVFLLRHHGSPTNLGRSFPIDRRALAQVGELGLSESQVRTAIALLEKLDLIRRVAVEGSPCQQTDAGVRRKPIFFRLGAVIGRVLKKLFAKRPTQRNPIAREAMPLGDARTSASKAPFPVQMSARTLKSAADLDDGLARALSRWLTGVRGKDRAAAGSGADRSAASSSCEALAMVCPT